MEYELTVGLEIHAELNTESKMYCSCRNVFGAEPNTNVCPVCMGFPGALPVLNRKAVESAVKMGLALHCKVHPRSRMARKNYFYPDLPKAYQISQAEEPLCSDGWVEFPVNGERHRIRIQRLHIEEDAGKMLHDGTAAGSMLDFNRCGVPLIEIVTDPDFHSGEEVRAFLETIRATLLTLDISDCRMQEGSIRCDVNVSVAEKGSPTPGNRCEMKNVNSFSGAVRGIAYEYARQKKLLESGHSIEQETRRWDDGKGMSFLMRSKENANDYRYFPEPDMGAVCISERRICEIAASVPETPEKKAFRYMEVYGIPHKEAVQLAYDFEKSCFYERCLVLGCSPRTACNWILTELTRYLNESGLAIRDTAMSPERFTALAEELAAGRISSTNAKLVFAEILRQNREPQVLISEMGLSQNSSADFLKNLARQVLEQNPQSLADFRNGKHRAFGYLIGQCMKASGGSANPGMVREIMEQLIQEEPNENQIQ